MIRLLLHGSIDYVLRTLWVKFGTNSGGSFPKDQREWKPGNFIRGKVNTWLPNRLTRLTKRSNEHWNLSLCSGLLPTPFSP
jgi:hypothetical protein